MNEDKFRLKFHSNIPPYSMYAVDDWIVIGFYWHGRGSISNPMILIEGCKKGTLGWNVMDTFERIWEKASFCRIIEKDAANNS